MFAQPPNALVAEMVHVFRRVIPEATSPRLDKSVKGEGELLLVVLQELEALLARDGVVAPGFVPPARSHCRQLDDSVTPVGRC
jgi:hypothetical protein